MARAVRVLLGCALAAGMALGDRRPAGMLQMSDQLPGQWVVAFAPTATGDDVARVIARAEALEPDNLEEGVVTITRIGASFTAVSLRFDETEKAGFAGMPGVAMVEGDYLLQAEAADGGAAAEGDVDVDVDVDVETAAPAGEVEGVHYVTVGGGTTRTRGRGAHGLASVESVSKMWPQGKVHFYISLTDARTEGFVRDAIAHWMEHTCVEFTECETRAGCPKPYMNFVSVKGCSAYMGMNKFGGVDTIDISKMCMFGGAVHEIGHALGMDHEQTRNDRDEFVYVNYGTLHQSVHYAFDKTGPVGRDYGPYNYKSVMHYNAFSFTQRRTTPSIVAPYPVGQYSGLSAGDVASIQWMYNECRATFEKPVPIASRDTSTTHVIPHTKLFQTEFNVQYGGPVVVTYATDAPAAAVEYSVPAGAAMRPVANNTFVRFVPTAAEAGREYTFTVTFTGAGGGGASASLTLRVTVADSEFVCNGISGSDANVCNGRGTCDGSIRSPCSCTGGYGGPYCEGYKSCPANYHYDFAEGQDVWKVDGVTSEWVPKYGGAFEIGVDEAESRGYAKLGLIKRSKPRSVRWSMARKLPDTTPGVVIEGLGGTCGAAAFRDGRWLFGGQSVEGVPAEYLEPGRDVAFAIAFDWRNREMSLSIEGVEYASGLRMGRCYGVDEVFVYGRSYLTSFHLDCYDPAAATPAPGPTGTPVAPETPAPATATPTPSPTTAAPPVAGECVDKTPGGERWYSGYGASYGCAYFGDERFIDQVPNRCEKWGNDKRNMGLVANEACCVCGGGDFVGETPAPVTPAPATATPEPARPTPAPVVATVAPETPGPVPSSPAPAGTPTPAGACADKTVDGGAAWHGSWGAAYGCAYFEDPAYSYRCERFGGGGRNFGLVAIEACCVCGGGDVAGVTQPPATSTPAPETEPPATATPVPEAPATGAPATPTGPPTPGTCADVTINGRTWYSGYGEPYGCDYFAAGATQTPSRCEKWGALKPSEGYVANTACCACGGGARGGAPATMIPTTAAPTSAPATPAPTQAPTAAPTPSPPATPVPPIAGGAVTPVCGAEQALPKDRYGWGPQRVTSGVDADYTRGLKYGASYGTGVDAYVLDSGTYCDHEEYAGRCTWGYTAVRASSRDRMGHGTHVAGIVGGATHGVAKNVSIVAVKIIDDSGFGSSTTSMKALAWVVEQAKKTGRPSVINMSVGGPKKPLYNAAVNAAVAEGVTVVAASGNEAMDACDRSPGSASDAITVGMTNRYDNRNFYSNYGDCVDVMAPGEDIRSAWIGAPAKTRVETGTSMAAPHVTGAVATFLSFNPAATPGQVRQWIAATAVETGLGRLKGSPDLLLQVPCVEPPRD